MVNDKSVTVVSGRAPGTYPEKPPFRPDREWDELGARVPLQQTQNPVYALVRDLFRVMELDRENLGTKRWNPLGDFIHPGQRVVIKPNLVRHSHPGGGDYRAVITHPAVIRALADYVGMALQGKGQIVIGDAPIQSTEWETLLSRTGLREVCDDLAQCWGIPVRLADFRLWTLRDGFARPRGTKQSGDSDGYTAVDLGDRSMLVPIDAATNRYRVTCYDPDTMVEHHNPTRHEYLIAKAVLEADVFINVPKLKTHRKVGLTAALKNAVGINGHKDWLPHHRVGSLAEGGDEYERRFLFKNLQTRLDENIYRNLGSLVNPMRRLTIRVLARLNRHLAPDPYGEGSWHGNDTCWRMVLDLNRVLAYATAEGEVRGSVQRRLLTVVDAVVAGEGEGPMRPTARDCNLLIAGENFVAVDAALATLIGFDFRKLPLIAAAFEMTELPLVRFAPEEVAIRSNDERFAGLSVGSPCAELCFAPPSSWAGHVEFEPALERAGA